MRIRVLQETAKAIEISDSIKLHYHGNLIYSYFNSIIQVMEKQEADKLIKELNELSSDTEKNKERMVEIAKVLLTDHYWYLPKKDKKW